MILNRPHRLLLVLALSVLAHTGGGTAAEPAPARSLEINACSFLSAAEVTAAMGLEVETGLRKDSGRTGDGAYADNGSYSSTCLWRVAADRDKANPNLPLGGASFAILNVMSWLPGSGDAKTFLQSFRDAGKEHTIAMIPVALAIGDEALWWGDGVAVRNGDISFGMSVHLVGERTRERGIAENLAGQIVGRLK